MYTFATEIQVNDNPDVLQWAFIAEGEGYKLYNKANNLYLGVNSGYVNVSADAVV